MGVASSDASVYQSSMEDFEYTCMSCLKKGFHVEAKGYCVDCSEYLCRPCIVKHLTDSALKGHVILHLNRIRNVSDVDSGRDGDSHNLRSVEVNSSSVEASLDMSNISFVKDVKVRTSHDSVTCRICGMALLSDGCVAVCDYDNSNVKIIDVDNDVIKDSLKLRHEPISMVVLPNDRLAITSQGCYNITILTTTTKLEVLKTIRTDDMGYGIAYFNGKLFVSFQYPLKFQVLDLSGTVLEEIIPDSEVKTICSSPKYIAVSADEKTIFVSDWKSKVILSMNRKGKKLAHCHDVAQSTGVLVLDQMSCMLVCDNERDIVQKMSLDLKNRVIVLNKGDDIQFPFSIAMCPHRQYLMISSLSSDQRRRDYIKIFQM
ncbi:hypothetical protein ACF0H5_000799 [Mactra antiquata]